MQVMEQITLRLTATGREEAVAALAGHLEGLRGEFELLGIRLYRHAAVETDLSVILECDYHGPLPSEPALRLAAGLRSLGIVHHSSWYLTESWRR